MTITVEGRNQNASARANVPVAIRHSLSFRHPSSTSSFGMVTSILASNCRTGDLRLLSSRPHNLWDWTALVLATGLGIGFVPVMPGTFGSLLGLLLAWLMGVSGWSVGFQIVVEVAHLPGRNSHLRSSRTSFRPTRPGLGRLRRDCCSPSRILIGAACVLNLNGHSCRNSWVPLVPNL